MKLNPTLARACLLLLGLVFTPTAVAVDTTIWVGSTLDCDQGNLQTAIYSASTSAADTTIIRVAKANIANASLSILNRNVRLYGGYTACFDPVPNAATTLSGGVGSVMLIAASGSERRYVRMHDFVVRDGNSTDDGYGGGIQIGGNVSVSLTSSSVLGNQASYGGGISILGGEWQPSLSLDRVRVGDAGEGNQASLGGGIYCLDADIFVANSSISANTAAWTGGGMHLNACTLSSVSFPAAENHIVGNQAVFGGGMAAFNGSVIKLGTINDQGSEPGTGGRTEFRSNSASEQGGGLYLSGADTLADIDAAVFVLNSANEYGGAVYVSNEAEFRLARGEEPAGMFLYDPYATMLANLADVDGNVAYVDAGGEASIRTAVIQTGGVFRPGATHGEIIIGQSTFHVDGASTLHLHGVRLTHMSGEGVVLANGAHADVSSSTFAANDFANDFRFLGSGSSLELGDNIIWDPPAVLVADAALGVITQHNNNVHDDSALPGGSITTDPGFVDADHDNYRLRGNSINVDTYTPTVYVLGQVDLEGNPRPFNLYPNHGGIFDRGAYELGDLIFANGFEDP